MALSCDGVATRIVRFPCNETVLILNESKDVKKETDAEDRSWSVSPRTANEL